MATWITHLRIAEILLNKISGLDEVSFLYGNLAPDSGLPNEDWTQYDPPKEVTHFLVLPHGDDAVRDLVFYRDYLQGLNAKNHDSEYSFKLGYYVHLLTDEFWWRKIARTTETFNQDLFSKLPRDEAFGEVKSDWYGLDHKYLRDHPDYIVWKKYLKSEIPQIPLPIMPQKAFDVQMKYIKTYYTSPDPERILDRAFPYLNDQTLDRFVGEASSASLKIIQLVKANHHSAFMNSSLSLLSSAETSAYEPPLGDVIE